VSSRLEPFETRQTPATQRRHGDLADVLERVLDKGIVVAGDISISLIDIELLTIKLRLLIASADKAREMGIDWWRHDPYLSGEARRLAGKNGEQDGRGVRALEQRLERLESILQSARPQDMEAQASGGDRSDGRPGSEAADDDVADQG